MHDVEAVEFYGRKDQKLKHLTNLRTNPGSTRTFETLERPILHYQAAENHVQNGYISVIWNVNC